jgi:hypothetical protein
MPPTPEELAASWNRVTAAFEALNAYIERMDREPDIQLHRRLSDDLTNANDEYLNLVAQLRP